MSLASSLNGTFGLDELKRMTWPIAWSGTVPVSEQVAEEEALSALVGDAIAQLQEAYTYDELEDGKELEVRIVNGEVTEIIEV